MSALTLRRVSTLALALALAAGCAPAAPPAAAAPAVTAVTAAGTPPPLLLGDFVDDYDNRYTITATLWTQQPHGRFHVVRWDAAGQYLIARNDSANTHAPGRWTRIDWVELPGMAPYTWAFCLTAFEAPTRAAAEATTPAVRETPRTGCNGYPFSRMRR